MNSPGITGIMANNEAAKYARRANAGSVGGMKSRFNLVVGSTILKLNRDVRIVFGGTRSKSGLGVQASMPALCGDSH